MNSGQWTVEKHGKTVNSGQWTVVVVELQSFSNFPHRTLQIP